MNSSSLGGLFGLLSSILWALSSVMFAWMAPYMDVLSMNMMRCLFAAIFFWLLMPFYGGLDALARIDPMTMLALVVSVFLLVVVGDSLYFVSSRMIGVSRAMPIASVNPLIALVLAIVWLNERLTTANIFGALLTIAGLYLVIRDGYQKSKREPPPGDDQTPRKVVWQGVVLALAAGIFWGVGVVVLKVGVTGVDVITVQSIRQAVAAILLGGAIAVSGRNCGQLRRLSGRLWAILFVNSIVSSFLGGIVFILAFQMAGAGKAAILTSLAPIFAVPLSSFILKERPTRVVALGALLAVGGITLVV